MIYGPKEVVINNRVFVGNMNYDTTQSEIESLFSEAGEVVEVSIPNDRNTGRPRGFAFVEFAESSSTTKAIEMFDGHELQGRNIRVSEAEQQVRVSPFSNSGSYGPSRGSGSGSGSGSSPKGSKPKGSRRNIRARKRGF